MLVPKGQLIDLRPLAVNPPIEIVTGDQVLLAGRVDDSAGIADDMAADESMNEIVNTGWFVREHNDSFEYKSYWDTVDEMQAYIKEQWVDAILPDAVVKEAQRLISMSNEGAKVRTRLSMMISQYRKSVK